MIILDSVNDALQLISDTNTAVDIHATWVDIENSSGTITPGRTNSAIVTPSTINIVAAPAASFQRNVKTVHVRNKGSSPCNITLQHTDGTVVAQLYAAKLNAGYSVQMTDGEGFSLESFSSL
jgi:hypothetical protein